MYIKTAPERCSADRTAARENLAHVFTELACSNDVSQVSFTIISRLRDLPGVQRYNTVPVSLHVYPVASACVPLILQLPPFRRHVERKYMRIALLAARACGG